MKKYLVNKIRRLIGTDKLIAMQIRETSELERQSRLLNEIYYANIFQSTIEQSEWLKNKSFSPGRWAVDYGFLYSLYRVLNATKPSKIVEFGLGQTSRMISQFCDFSNTKYFVFEHDQSWIDFFSLSYNFGNSCELCFSQIVKTKYKGFETFRYSDDIGKRTGKNVELVILDGPLGASRYSRIQVLDLIPEYINRNNFCFLIDDYQRDGEKDTVEELIRLLSLNNIECLKKAYSSHKDHLLICSINNHFLTSL